MLILNANEVHKSLPMPECIEAMKKAFGALSSGQVEMPLRTRVPLTEQDGISLFMPSYLKSTEEAALAIKIVSVFNQNPSQGLPLIHAAVVVLNPITGAIDALLEGAALTAIRTGAGSGAATDLLARKDAKTIAILGAGVQARSQLQAVCSVRPIETVSVYTPKAEDIQAFIRDMSGQGSIPKDMRSCDSSAEAVRDADVICAATTSSTPVFDDKDIKAGVHINGIGSYKPDVQEVPSATVARAKVSVDSRQAALVESGDIAIPLKEGLVDSQDIEEIGEIVLEPSKGRQSENEITFFKSVGVAIQDAVAGELALKNARKLNLGTEVDW